jgi:DNA/RNA-binding domain of Phe-tRNA-synthetase-like protein
LRHGGYKPTGRGKPASEYLVKAAAEGIGPINLAVDACNAVSLHSGLPISVVDLDRVVPPLWVGVVVGDARYVFNLAGQEIRLEGLLCLHDQEGPCANGVKDSQRTKTRADTRRTLSLIWGSEQHAAHTVAAGRWYRALLERAGAETVDVTTTPLR